MSSDEPAAAPVAPPAPQRAPRVDVILFNGESVLALRLAYLTPHVDAFVIVEARRAHSGAVKLPGGGYYHTQPDFAEVIERARKHRPVYVLTIPEFPAFPSGAGAADATGAAAADPDSPPAPTAQAISGGSNLFSAVLTPAALETAAAPEPYMAPGSHASWFREKTQRNWPTQFLLETFPDPATVFVVADVDEIPTAGALAALSEIYGCPPPPEAFADRESPPVACGPVHLECVMYYYNYNWKKKYPWLHPYAIGRAALGALVGAGLTLSDMRTGPPPTAPNADVLIFALGPLRVLPNAGVHLSYFLSRADLRRKLASFAHRECDRPENKTDAHLTACFCEGRDLMNRDAEHERLVRAAPTEAGETLGVNAVAFQQYIVAVQEEQYAAPSARPPTPMP
jgi:hypothetical protein